MNTTALASAVAGFLIGGLVASTAASLNDEPDHSRVVPATSSSDRGL
ncbi:hypothetical protein [Sporichthya polymorpha]|nr:hypothetical protein [Sporichthya polymorpha]